jgi:TonB family protein
MPEVPQRASATIQGKVSVVIRAAVDASGAVSNATFESEGPSKYFARLALDASRQWKFQPAQTRGQPLPSVWILRFEFRQSGTEVVPEERAP